MKLYWYAKWGLPKDVQRHIEQGVMVVPNDRMEQNMAGVYQRGRKDYEPERERIGVVALGEEVYRLVERFRGQEKREGWHDTVPLWELERLLEQWNVPAPTDLPLEHPASGEGS